MEISKADLYALREFLVAHYAGYSKYLKDTPVLFGKDHYSFTHVNEDGNGGYGFELRRAKAIILMYDLIKFNYNSGSITVRKNEIKDDTDKEQVNNIVNVLNNRCYKDIISNLDDLTG